MKTPSTPDGRSPSGEQAVFRQDNWQVGNVEQFAQKTINNTYVTTPPPRCAPEPPKFLRYLIDRSKQAAELERLSRSLLVEPSSGFAACIIAGPRNELHEALVHRYREVMLPAILEQRGLQNSIGYRRLDWPEAIGGGKQIDGRYAGFCDQLQKAIGDFDDDQRAAMDRHQRLARALSGYEGHLLFRVNLYAESWSPGDPSFIEHCLKFWAGFGEQPRTPCRLRILFLCIHYETGTPSPWRRWSSAVRTVRKIRQCLGRLAASDLERVFVLPELEPIKRFHVSEWATNTVPQQYGAIDEILLKAEAERVFQDEAVRPLEELAVPLSEALKKAAGAGIQVTEAGEERGTP